MAGALGEVRVPSLGESIREATIAKWLKTTGDAVKADEILVELETDKVTLEVTAPTTGVLAEVKVGTGATVTVGDLLGIVVPGEATAQPPKEEKKAPPPKVSTTAAVVPSAPIPSPQREQPVNLSPSVRKLVEELGVNPTGISGSGKGGRLTKEDVLSLAQSKGETKVETRNEAAETPQPTMPQRSSVVSNRREERVKMTRLRQRIAERLKEAQNTAAILTTFNEIDMSAINAIRAKYKEAFEKKHGVRLGMMSFFIKACIQALKEIPAINAEIDGQEIIYKNYYDIGVAVSAPQGLVVPIVRDADMLSFAEIEKAIADLALKAREGKLTIEEMTGGTFTITNGGVFGSLMATPILNPPQTGILGMHKIEERPVAINGKVEIRPMMYVALSYDHRVVDGRESVTFLVRVKENLEDPERLQLEM